MAIGTQGDIVLYNEQFNQALVETLAQNAAAFNEVSAFTMIQDIEFIKGLYAQSTFWLENANLVQRRDSTSVAAATDEKFTQAESVEVKLDRKYQVAHTLDSFRKMGVGLGATTPEEIGREMSTAFGLAIANGVQLNMVNDLITALVASIDAGGALEVGSGVLDFSHTYFTDGKATFGDAGEDVACYVMHSFPFYQLEKLDASNAYEIGTRIRVFGEAPGTNGRPVIVTDAPALALGANDFVTLGLMPGAGRVSLAENFVQAFETVTGLDSLVYRMQAEWSTKIGVKGQAWDIATGGANPDNTALATEANWDQVASSVKNTAGFRILSGETP